MQDPEGLEALQGFASAGEDDDSSKTTSACNTRNPLLRRIFTKVKEPRAKTIDGWDSQPGTLTSRVVEC